MRKLSILLLSILILLLILIFMGCEEGDTINAPEEEPDPNIITYYWENGWIEHAKWKTTTLGTHVTVRVEAWNWQPEFSSFSVKFDNIIAYWNMDSASQSGGLLDDFENGVDHTIWNLIVSEGAGVYVSNGLLNVDIPEGKSSEGEGEVGGVITKEFMVYGDFDISVDFVLNPEYHSTPNCNTKLFLTDKSGNSIEISIRDQHYRSSELPYGRPGTSANPWTQTDHLSGKLRIVRKNN